MSVWDFDFICPSNMRIKSSRTLILSDCHFPFQNNEAITRALKEGKRYKPDTIILNGDVLDCHAISRWLTDPKQRNFKAELEMTKKFLIRLRKTFPKQKIIYKMANHEFRLQAYMFTHAAELSDLEEIKLPALLGLKELNILVVGHLEVIHIGKFTILHGDEIRLSGAHPARTLFNKCKADAIASHVHRPSEHYSKTIDGRIIRCYTTPCLCNLSPDFMPYNDWLTGYTTLTDGTVNITLFELK